MPPAYERCVKDVKRNGKVDNPFAVCRASMGSDKEIRARAKRKKKRGSARG